MKNSILTIIFALVALASFGQKSKGWTDLENMKTMMKQTFPPMMKDNDLTAAKKNAAELYEKAVALQNGKKPRAFRKAAMAEKFSAITAYAKEMKDSLVSFHGAFAAIAHHKKAGMEKGHKKGEMKGEGKMNHGDHKM
jgi:hypothetical protein